MPEGSENVGSNLVDKSVSSIADDQTSWPETHEKAASLYDLDIHKAEARLATAQAQETEDLIAYRTKFSKFFAGIFIGWISIVTLLLLTRGFYTEFNLSDLVMSVLLGSFTITILTPSIVFARYLFRSINGTDS